LCCLILDWIEDIELKLLTQHASWRIGLRLRLMDLRLLLRHYANRELDVEGV